MIRHNDNLRRIYTNSPDKDYAIFETLLSIKSLLEEHIKEHQRARK